MRTFPPLGNVDALGLAVPHILTATTDLIEAHALDLDVDCAGRRHDPGLIIGDAIIERVAALQLDDIEIIERHTLVIDVDDRTIGAIEGRNVHVSSFRVRLGA